MAAEFSSNPDLSIYKGTVYSSREYLPQKGLSPRHAVPQSGLAREENGYGLSKYNDPAKLSRKTRTSILLAICFAYLGMGINSASVGTTLVHMGCLYDADTQEMSFTFVALNVGFVIGAVLSGFVHNLLNSLLQFACCSLLLGLAAGISPWMPHLYGFQICTGISAGFQGYMHCGAIAYIVSICPTQKGPAIQGINAVRAFGSFMLPVIAMSFLVDLPMNANGIVHISNQINSSFPVTMSNGSDIFNLTVTNASNYDDPAGCTVDGIESVRFPYLVTAIVNICASIIFFIFVIVLKEPIVRYRSGEKNIPVPIPQDENDAKTNQNKTEIKLLKIVIFMLAILYVVVFYWYDYVFYSFLSTFAIKGLKLPVEKAAFLVSVFYGSYTAGRIIAIFTSIILTPAKMITINSTFTLIAFSMLVFAESAEWIVWVAVAIAGFFLASTFPALILWISDYMVLSSAISSTLITTNAITTIVGSVVLGYLLQNYSHMSMIYLDLACCVVSCVLFLTMVLIGLLYKRLTR